MIVWLIDPIKKRSIDMDIIGINPRYAIMP